MPTPIGNYVGFATGTDGTSGEMDGVFNLFDQIRLRRLDEWIQAAVQASGGAIIPAADAGNGYKYHVFESSGSLIVTAGETTQADVLIVGGGGSGGGGQGGGGGGGGVVYGTSVTLSVGTYPVTVGSGGAAIPTAVTYGSDGNNGSPSSFNGVTALGGGGGLRNNYGWPTYPSAPSGLAPNIANSGGGGGGSGPSAASKPRTPQPVPGDYTAYGGNAGAPQGGAPGASGGGGGGAGGGSPGPSAPRSSGTSSPGGNGVAIPAFPATIIGPKIPGFHRSNFNADVGPTGLYGGGGGGGEDGSTGNGLGGPGGGGRGGDTDTTNRVGAFGTGGGGGATGTNASPHPYAPNTAGGSGIVIVRYQ